MVPAPLHAVHFLIPSPAQAMHLDVTVVTLGTVFFSRVDLSVSFPTIIDLFLAQFY